MPENMDEISELCVSCGMCCDGTLFSRGFLRDEEDRRVAEGLGLATFEFKDKLFFKLPCIHFSSCCTIYEQRRPNICGEFFCPPLIRYKKGKETFAEARAQVEGLKKYRDKMLTVAHQFPETQNLGFRQLMEKMEEFSMDNQKIKAYKDLFLVYFIFEDMRKRYFKYMKKGDSASQPE